MIDSIYRFALGGSNCRIRYNKSISNNANNICIILDRGMGDFLLFSYYLKIICNFYLTTNNVYIIADEYNYEFYKQFEFDSRIKVIVLKMDKLEAINGEHLLIYRGQFKKAILPLQYITPRCAEILRVLSPKEIYSVGKRMFPRKYTILDYFIFRKVKTYNIKMDFYCKMHREFTYKHLGLISNLEVLIPVANVRLLSEDYFLINVSASSPLKLPSVDQFIDIAETVKSYTGLIPVFIGNIPNNEIYKFQSKNFNMEYVDKNDMNQAISLCKYAKYVITAETGIYHLALSIDSESKIIVINWCMKNILFYPYPSEMKKQYDRVVFLSKYNDCKQCPNKGIKCIIDRYMKNTVYCIKMMNSKDVLDVLRE